MDRIVKFLGKHLFFPVIIRACQFAKINQYLFYRMMYVLVYFWFTVDSFSKGYYIWSAVLGVIFGLTIWILLLRWDSWSLAAPWLIKFFLLLLGFGLVIDMIMLFLSNGDWISKLEFMTKDTGILMTTFGEYAKMLDTIPPEETKEKAKAWKKASDAA